MTAGLPKGYLDARSERTEAVQMQTVPEEIKAMAKLYYAIEPASRVAAASAAIQAMISFLPPHTAAAHGGDV